MLQQGDYYLYCNLCLYTSTNHDIFTLLTVHDVFMLLTVHDLFTSLTVHDVFMLRTVHDLFMLLTVHDIFMLLTVHDPGPSVRQQINSWNILYYANIVKGEYHSYCTRYNVCITVPSLLHPIQCITLQSLLHVIHSVYLCTVPIASDAMCVSSY